MNIQEYRQGIGWTLSVTIHAVVLFTGILLVAEAPKFSVEKPPPSVEVELFTPLPPTPPLPVVQPDIAPPPPPEPSPLPPPPETLPPPVVTVEEPVTPSPEAKPEFAQFVPPPEVAPPQQILPSSIPPPISPPKPTVNNSVTTSAKAAYLVDPLPPYPEASRRAHEQGTVLLLIKVDASGKPIETTIKQTSGFLRLDRAAQDWIQQNYKFQPATINGLPVAAEVTIPIRFSLE